MATVEDDALPCGETSADPHVCSFGLKLFWRLCQDSKWLGVSSRPRGACLFVCAKKMAS